MKPTPLPEKIEPGHERGRHIKRTYSTITVVTPGGGETNIEYCSGELTVAEKYCTHCKDYISTESAGILGFAFCPQCNRRWKE